MSTKFGLSKNPDAYETKALQYEQKGKAAKALKNRNKAARLRGNALGNTHGVGNTGFVPVVPPMGTTYAPVGVGGYPGATTTTTTTTRNFATYESKALRWEQRNNLTKAQKNREKAWRFNNPQYANMAAPQFYQNSRFIGYNVPMGTVPLAKGPMMSSTFNTSTYNTSNMMATHSVMAPTIVETHVRPTVVEQTVRTEKVIEIQPVIHREVDAPHVKVIEKHMYETVPSAGSHTITNQAIVEETVRPRIIEEIQPVVHRNVAQTFVEHVEQHSTEHIVRPTVTTKEVIQDRAPIMGVAAGGPILVNQGVNMQGAGFNQGLATQTTTTTSTSDSFGQTVNTSHSGLAQRGDSFNAGQHNAAHMSQVNQTRRF